MTKLEKSIMLKKSSGRFDLGSVDRMKRNIFEHFIIVGAPPDVSNNNFQYPQILNLFPSSPLYLEPEEMNQVIQFCFPNGFAPLSDNELKHDTPVLDQYVFRIGGKDESAYGVCTRLRANRLFPPFFASESSALYPFVFCFLTRFPVLSSHFHFLCFLVMTLNKKDEYRLKSVNRKLATLHNGRTLPSLEVQNNIGTWPKINPSKKFFNQLHLYYSIKMLKYSEQTFQLTHDRILTIPPSTSDSTLVAMCSLDTLFSLLTIENIIILYTAIILDHFVIFQSNSPRRLSLSVFALRSLVSPLPVSTPMMPILPSISGYLDILQSPIPYICGVLKSAKIPQLDSDSLVVDLDNNVIKGTITNTLPESSMLAQKVKAVLDRNLETITIPSRKIIRFGFFSTDDENPEFDKFFESADLCSMPPEIAKFSGQKYLFNSDIVKQLLFVFSRHIAPDLEERMSACFVTDSTDRENPITVLNTDVFMAHIPDEAKGFFREFVGTTAFQQFADRKTDEFDIEKTDICSIDSSLPRFPKIDM